MTDDTLEGLASVTTQDLMERPRDVLDAVRTHGRALLVDDDRPVAVAHVLGDREEFDGLTAVQSLGAFEADPKQALALLLGDYKFRKTVGVSAPPDYRIEIRPLTDGKAVRADAVD